MEASITITEHNVQPYGAQLLVRRLPTEDKSKGGIVLPSTMLNQNMYCRVLKVGPGEYLGKEFVSVKDEIHPGDVVLVRQMDGGRVSPRDRELLLVHQDLIEGIASDESWPVS